MAAEINYTKDLIHPLLSGAAQSTVQPFEIHRRLRQMCWFGTDFKLVMRKTHYIKS